MAEIRFLEAENDAKALDEHLLRTGQTVGPLHGLPISIKDRFNIEGLESACGYVSWLGDKKDSASEGVLVKRLRRLGVVFFVKTNVPMSMLVRQILRYSYLSDGPVTLIEYATDGGDKQQYHRVYNKSVQSTSFRGRSSRR